MVSGVRSLLIQIAVQVRDFSLCFVVVWFVGCCHSVCVFFFL